ncbi:cytochrome c oxidase subunit II [Isosphaeraceae bacterium EP7]
MWNFPFLPDQASEQANQVDGVMYVLLAVTAFFTVLIAGQVIFFGIKYRAGSKANRSGRKSTSHNLEAFWIGSTFIICVVMYIISTHVFFQMYNPPADASEIYVVAKRWMWYLQHPEGRREQDELHVPLGKAIKLVMTSQDVIHSFYVPAFRVKQDVLPGRTTALWFRPTKAGAYNLFCAEYCGSDHSRMIGTVYVMEPSDYERWLTGGPESGGRVSMASAGEQLFQKNHCSDCHSPAGQPNRGPTLVGLHGGNAPIQQKGGSVSMVKADDAYIRESILDPRAKLVAGFEPIMPSFKDQISEQDLFQIIAYIKSLGKGQEGGR